MYSSGVGKASSGVIKPEIEAGLEGESEGESDGGGDSGERSKSVAGSDTWEEEGGLEDAAEEYAEEVTRSGSLVVRSLGARDTWETAALRGGLGLAVPFTPTPSGRTMSPIPPTTASLLSPRITPCRENTTLATPSTFSQMEGQRKTFNN